MTVSTSPRIRSKTIAATLAFVFGALGLHRFYLFGARDIWAWLTPVPTLAGLIGLARFSNLGQDDRLAWVLIPVFGLSVAVACGTPSSTRSCSRGGGNHTTTPAHNCQRLTPRAKQTGFAS